MKPIIIITAITVAPGAALAWLGDKFDHEVMKQAGVAMFAMFFVITPLYLLVTKKQG